MDAAGTDDVAADAAVDAPDAPRRSEAPACVHGNVPQGVAAWTTTLDILADTPLQRANLRAVDADRTGRVYMGGFYDRAGPATFRGAVWRFQAESPTLDPT